MNRERFACLLIILTLSATYSPGAAVRESAMLLPWQASAAEHRQVVHVSAAVSRRNSVARFTLSPPPGRLSLRVVDAQTPKKALPVYVDGAGRVSVCVPGEVSPRRPRLLVAYWFAAAGGPASPVLAEPPVVTDDFATSVFGDAWDFDEGDQDNITSWGNRPTEYGKVSVRAGKLVIPVTGNDPYFIWGVMWGSSDDPRALHIDSSRYRTLRIRLRQSCKQARWTLYMTDSKGVFRSHEFRVKGTQWQEMSFDLPKLFAGFWDGREFRALRIDTTNNRPGTTVEIDWVKLLPAPVAVEVGPLFSRAETARRKAVRALRVRAADTAEAGAPLAIRAQAFDAVGKPVAAAPLTIGRFLDGGAFAPAPTVRIADGATAAARTVGQRAGSFQWTLGVLDDLGYPAPPIRRLTIRVTPAALDHFELIPARRLVLTDRREVKLAVWGADRFGNRRPVDIPAPRFTSTGGAQIRGVGDAKGPLRGAPAEAIIRCSTRPLTRHVVTLHDNHGHTGRTELMTMTLKQHPVTLTRAGYFVGPAGKLFLPLGGFYANWPAGPPDATGAIQRSVDLFPCGAVPYPHGFPWSAEIERKVNDYLDLCRKQGVTALRLMLRNMDLVGRVDSVQLQAVLHLFDLARPRGIRFDVVLFEDYNKPPYCNAAVLEKVVLPHYKAADLKVLSPHRARFLVEKRLLGNAALKYTDPDAIACQKDYLVDLLPYLAGRDEIFCYELENEMVHPPISWVNEMTAFIRGIDPKTPVLGDPGPHAWPEPWRWREARCDLFGYHPYNDGTTRADHGAVVFIRSKWAAAGGLPMFTGEGGINQNRWQKDVKKVPSEYAMRGIRDQIWLSLCCGANGAFMWTASHELEMAEFGKVPRALAAVGVDLLDMHRLRPRTVLVMPDDASANDNAYALGWKLLDLGIDFDTLPAAAATGYARRIEAATTDPKAVSLTPDLFRPSTGYQLAFLADNDLNQALVYLRNTAGGRANLGTGRSCHLRRPKTVRAAITVVADRRWKGIRAFDLDDGREVPVSTEQNGRVVLVSNSTGHDFIVGLKR